MSKPTEAIIARLFFYFGLGVTGGYLYLIFILPQYLEAWRDIDKELSAIETLGVRLSDWCMLYGFKVMPIVVLATFGAGHWRGKVDREVRRDTVCD